MDRFERTGWQRQTRDLTGWGVGTEKTEWLWTSLERSEFPISPEMENFHWLEDDSHYRKVSLP